MWKYSLFSNMINVTFVPGRIGGGGKDSGRQGDNVQEYLCTQKNRIQTDTLSACSMYSYTLLLDIF